MARRPRLAVPALPHHVIQRGNNRQPIFFTDADYRVFLACLAKANGPMGSEYIFRYFAGPSA